MKSFALLLAISLTFVFNLFAQENPSQGTLQAINKKGKSLGECPLKHTDVKAEISGFISRVKVTQEFENNYQEKIEAVYTFPLPQDSAVDDMTMKIGERTIRGKIMKQEEAAKIYETAKNAGQSAALLDQERPNIFTQAVANILPGEKIIIEITYVETLKYEAGSYEFVFPMVVGPRYIPGTPTGKGGGGYSPDTTKVPDASRITPNVAEGRAGHDISIEVKINAGVPIKNFSSKSHQIESDRQSENSATIKLKNENTIPNKDFVLRYDVADKKINDALLTHRDEKGGFFTFILQPPDSVKAKDVTPKEIVFVLDTSGSMSGFPIEKAKESMKMALKGLYPNDTFNLITFAGDTSILFDKPVPATRANLKKAYEFLESRQGSGGTEMMKAIKAALDPTDSQEHLRIVCFMTDGYVGNDMEIISEVQKHPNARVFSFGIGSSVNRFLLDKMAEEGRGEVEYVSLKDDGSKAAKRFHERIRNPLLTDISIDWNGMEVADVYPKKKADLFSAKPVVIHGRYTKAGSGTIRLRGRSGGKEFVKEIPVNFPENEARDAVLSTLWARTRVDNLMSQDYQGMQAENPKSEIKDTITQLGLEYRLLTQFTSFVAVEEKVVTEGGKPKRIDVPVEIPEGVNRETALPGISTQQAQGLPVINRAYANMSVTVTAGRTAKSKSDKGSGRGSGQGRGQGSGSGSASVANKSANVESLELTSPNLQPSKPPTPEEIRLLMLANKLHEWVYLLVERLQKNTQTASEYESEFVSDGKASLRIVLSETSPEAISKLKALGFEIIYGDEKSTVITGKIPLGKIGSIAELKQVKLIQPEIQ